MWPVHYSHFCSPCKKAKCVLELNEVEQIIKDNITRIYDSHNCRIITIL